MAPLYARYVPPKVAHTNPKQEDQNNIQKKSAPLYARYVPPKNVITDLSNGNAVVGADALSDQAVTKKRKRNTKDVPQTSPPLITPPKASEKLSTNGHETNDGVDSPRSISIPGKSTNIIEDGQTSSPLQPSLKRKKRLSSHAVHENEPNTEDSQKYSGVLSKYQKSIQSAEERRSQTEADEVDEAPVPELHDLVPIPIPEEAPQATPFSSLAALPPWLASPIRVPANSAVPFADMELDAKLKAHLQSKGLSTAMPVQTGVLPLLLPTKHQHPGDICVSAATGSGKTLAYILPIVESLRKRVLITLKAVIVVPTRELVNQVRDTVEMCITGTDIKVGTALGTHALDVEQQQLVKVTQTYDPQGYRRILEIMSNNDYTESDFGTVEAASAGVSRMSLPKLPLHVLQYTSKVDILVCTPGRLVDHIKSTTGFTLEDVKWFVIDEADRLLDESFQEWVNVVQDALNPPRVERTDTMSPHSPLAGLMRAPPRHRVRKVVLSATMTRDLDKLASLKLRNPRLVVVQGSESSTGQVANGAHSEAVNHGALSLPSTLEEVAVSVDDGALKPLYLLKMLQDILGDATKQKPKTPSKSPANDVSDNSESEPSESGDSDTDSDSSIESSSDKSSSSSGTSNASVSPQATSTSSASPPSQPQTTKLSMPSSSAQSPNALIFTSTNESAHRLHHLLTHLHPSFATITTTLTKAASGGTRTTRTLRRFLTGRIRILIATDRASRGLDLPNLTNVINYDVPHSATSYVHRVGRTARAGKQGKAWTLVEGREAAWFWNVVARGKVSRKKGSRRGDGVDGEDEGQEERIVRGDGKGVVRVRVDVGNLEEGTREKYERALEKLKEDIVGGGGGG